MGVIRIKGIPVITVIGVLEWERGKPQSILVDVEARVRAEPSIKSGGLDDTADYHALVEIVQSLLKEKQFGLLEEACDAVAKRLLGEFELLAVSVRIHKPEIAEKMGVSGVSVEITRKK